MGTTEQLKWLHHFANQELTNSILPFWRKNAIDNENSGFVASIDNCAIADTTKPKGIILNSRILWTFSAAFLHLGHHQDKTLAQRAFDYLLNHFYDHEYGGFFWSLQPDGTPLDRLKQIWAQAFAIYGLTEYYNVTADHSALNIAIDTFNAIEKNGFDSQNGGYISACLPDWAPYQHTDSPADEKSTGTHLHLLEAYTRLYSIWSDKILAQKLRQLIDLFLSIIVSSADNHLFLSFNENWEPTSSLISYGHDFEASWLVYEAALCLGDKDRIHRTEKLAVGLTDAGLEGYTGLGAIAYSNDRKSRYIDNGIEWWPQAEALIALLNSHAISGNGQYINIAATIANFIENYIVDKTHGEWFYRVTPDGTPVTDYEKVGLWKCPYHNSRACMELINRTVKLLTALKAA